MSSDPKTKQAKERASGKRSAGDTAKIAIPIVFFIAALIFMVWVFNFSEKQLKQAAETSLVEIGHEILLNTERFLDPAEFIVDANAVWIETMFGHPGFELGFYNMANLQMAEAAHFNLIYFGDDNGNQWAVKKERDDTVRMRIITRLDDSPASREIFQQASRLPKATQEERETLQHTIAPLIKTAWYDRNQAGTLTLSEVDPLKVYDPRLRPWYMGAQKRQGRTWSDVYTWEDKRQGESFLQAGITVSEPVFWRGEMIGVTAVDLFLRTISDFLKDLEISPMGRAFIFDAEGLLVGLPNFEALMQTTGEEGGGVQQIHVHQVNDHAKWAAYQQLRTQLQIPDGQPVTRFDAQIVRFSVHDESFFGFFKPLNPAYNLNWFVGVLIPEEDIKGPLKEKFRWIVIAFIILAMLLFALIPLYMRVEKERRFIRGAFSKYVSPNRVDFLMENPDQLSLGGEYRECSFVMTDLAGFTALMEKIGDQADPEIIVSILNDYLEGMVNIAFQHEGTLDRIVGDAVAVLFSAPVVQKDHADRAVQCALAMNHFANDFSQQRQKEGMPFGHTRIGVNSGRVLLGNFGGKAVFDYRALGDPVNTAARLETVNDQIGTRMCVSNETVRRLAHFSGRPVGVLILKGKTEGIQVFEPVDEALSETPLMQAYAQAYQHMKNKDPGAEAAFAKALEQWPEDPLLRFHHKRLLAGEEGETITFSKK